MKRTISIIGLIIFSVVVLPGCYSTTTTIEFDKEGNITKKTVIENSAVNEAIISAKGKSIAMWSNGWVAFIKAKTISTESGSPIEGEINAGKIDNGYVSIRPDQENLEGMAMVIQAMRYGNLSISTTGITAENQANIEKSDTDEKSNNINSTFGLIGIDKDAVPDTTIK